MSALEEFELHARHTLEGRGLKDAWTLPRREILFEHYLKYYRNRTLEVIEDPECYRRFINGERVIDLYGKKL